MLVKSSAKYVLFAPELNETEKKKLRVRAIKLLRKRPSNRKR